MREITQGPEQALEGPQKQLAWIRKGFRLLRHSVCDLVRLNILCMLTNQRFRPDSVHVVCIYHYGIFACKFPDAKSQTRL